MPAPNKIDETPLSWIRAGFGRGKCVCLIDSRLPFGRDDETMKLAAALSASDRLKRYWLFVFPSALHNRRGKDYSFTGSIAAVSKMSATDDFDYAESTYASWAQIDTGKANPKRGLQYIGTDED